MTDQLLQRPPGPVTVTCNTRNSATGPLSGQYFTLSGSAIDYGEDGLVGRGNARSGPITPGQQAGNEALFGKVGGWLVDEASRTLAEKTGRPCRIAVMWRSGSPYPEPASLDITTRPDPGHEEPRTRGPAPHRLDPRPRRPPELPAPDPAGARTPGRPRPDTRVKTPAAVATDHLTAALDLPEGLDLGPAGPAQRAARSGPAPDRWWTARDHHARTQACRLLTAAETRQSRPRRVPGLHF
ncbi:methionine adenosyltransferase [Streptomyces microflavus]|uniref:methionine adenosyltransferase n=1 Tax=Streptomyces microflavus TaxID=1919 RepID=UPI003814D995